MTFDPRQVAYLLGPDKLSVLDVFGPTIEILTRAVHDPSAPTLLRGTLPPGVVVPMHAHNEPETFVVVSGELEGLIYPSEGEPKWTALQSGQVFHVPPNARHALRNSRTEPNVAIIISTVGMAEFFAEIGEPVASTHDPVEPPTRQRLQRMAELALERGDWNATLEENSAVGIEIPGGP